MTIKNLESNESESGVYRQLKGNYHLLFLIKSKVDLLLIFLDDVFGHPIVYGK